MLNMVTEPLNRERAGALFRREAVSRRNAELINAQEKENAAPVLAHQSGKVEHV